MAALEEFDTQHEVVVAMLVTNHASGVAKAANNDAQPSHLRLTSPDPTRPNTAEDALEIAKDHSVNPNLLVNRVRVFYKYFDLDPFIDDRDKLYLKFMEALGLGERAALERLDDLKEFVECQILPNPTGDFSAASSSLPTSLPDAPPKYPYKPRMEGGIEKYLRDNWLPYLRAGILSRPDLKRIDRPAYYALNNFLKGGSGGERRLPDDVHVPDRSEALNNELLGTGLDKKTAKRIANALDRRSKPSL